MRSSVVQVGSH